MGFAVIARCERTGELGAALASISLAGGASLNGAVRPNAGAILIQGLTSIRLNRLATNLLSQGHTAAHVLSTLETDDRHWDFRQVAVVDANSGVAIHCGGRPRHWSGIHTGRGYAVLCERAADSTLIESMAQAFERSPEMPLDERLLETLEAGAAVPAGGNDLAVRSTGLVVWGQRAYSDIDLRVDWHARPVEELRRIYDEFKPSAAYYEERARNPRSALNAKEFAGLLQNRKAGKA